jgi:long-chain-fatty-acyl-CoA reductase
MRTVRLPIVVCGETREGPGNDGLSVQYESGITVELPRVTAADVARIRAASNQDLHELSIDDITIFLAEVGKRWNNPDAPLRKQALQYSCDVTGYSPRMVGYDYFVVGAALTRPKMYDMLATELGDPYLLDEWRPYQAVYRHLQPRGKVLHVMVGNVPMAALFTMVRSILTKNVTIAKLPMRDLVTSLYFALTCLEVDPNHPVSRSLSVLYYEGGSSVEDQLIDAADVVCVWGQKIAVENVKRKLKCGQEFVEFGPKRGVHLLGKDTPDWDYAAMKTAYDVSIYDQEGCFCPQFAFVEGNPQPFVDRLRYWLDRHLERLPKGPESEDVQAHISRSRLEAKLNGYEVFTPGGTGWTVIVTSGPVAIHEHPLSRTLYVFPVENLTDCFPWITRDVQTAAVHPFSRALEIADRLTVHGVDRIVDIGRSGRPRPGFTHDGILPLTRFVRYISIERPLSFKYHFVADDPDIDDREIYGWTGESKSPRPYRFTPRERLYGYRGVETEAQSPGDTER